MTRLIIPLTLSLLLAAPALADEAPAKTEEPAKKKKAKTVIDFSEMPCEGDDCTVVGEVHEPRVQYIITRQGVGAETLDEAMKREEADLKKAASGAKKAKKAEKASD